MNNNEVNNLSTANSGLCLKAENLEMSYSDAGSKVAVFSNLSFQVGEGQSLAIIGESGVGKTSLLYVLGALDTPTLGDVNLFGTSYAKLRQSPVELSAFRGANIGFVFQFHHLLPEFDAVENVAMPLIIRGISQDIARDKAKEILSSLGLKLRFSHRPTMLSGGEQQRVAIARAFVSSPRLILADEPTGNLDLKTASEVFSLLKSLQKSNNTTLIVVTHSLEIAKNLDAVVELTKYGLTTRNL